MKVSASIQPKRAKLKAQTLGSLLSYIVLDSQGGQTVTGPYGPYDFGPADNTGYAATEYFNDGSGPVIADGMYKATLYGKSNADGTYSDEKAKSKVFTVDCSSVDETIDPVQPTIDTQASADSIKLGESVTDTATVTGTDANGEVDGTVDFFACGPAGSNPDCSTGGTEVGSGEVGDGNQAVSPEFTPTAAGRYCFRAEYTPADGSNYLAATHTNQTTECFEVAAPVSVGQGGNGDNGGTPSDPGQGGTPAGSGSTPSGGTPSGMPVAVLGASTGPVQVLGTATLPATGSESDLPWLASLLGAMAAYWVSRRRLRLAEVGLD